MTLLPAIGFNVSVMKKLRHALLFAAIAVGTLFVMGFGISSARTAPDYAVVVVDAEQKLYFAPPCTTDRMRYFVRITLSEARKRGFQVDSSCREASAFQQEDWSLSGQLLQRLGVLPSLRSRWNPDGSWNW